MRTFIDLTDEESHWNGALGTPTAVVIQGEDDLGGAAMALNLGDVQIVLTTTQMITIYEVIDGWMNDGPMLEVSDGRKRAANALREMIKDRAGIFKKVFSPLYSEEAFIMEFLEYVKMFGLRLRIKGEDPMRNERKRRKPVSKDEALPDRP